MSYKWTDKTSLCYKSRYFRYGDKIPSGILADDRIKEFIRTGKIESDATVSKTEIVAPVVKDAPAKPDFKKVDQKKQFADDELK